MWKWGRRVWARFTGTSVTFSDSTPRPVDQMVLEMLGRGASPRVGREEALSVPAVQRGRNLICSSISTLPLIQLDPNRNPVRSNLLEHIDPDVPNVVTLAQTLEDLLFEGIAWWRIIGFDSTGYPSRVRRLDPNTVSLQPPAGKSPAPLPSGYEPRQSVIYVDGKEIPVSEMIGFHSPNPAVLKVGGRAIKRAILLDQAARMYADNPRPLDYFTPAEGNPDPVEDDEVEDILGKWLAARKKRTTAYVPAALKYNTVDLPTPADLQLAELQKQAALEIANAFGVDPEDLGISTTSRTYANAVDRRRDRINDVLAPYMRAITDRLSMGDVTRRGYKVVFDLDDYLKADPKTRAEVQKMYLEMGVTDADEIRTDEGMPARRTQARPQPARTNASSAPAVTGMHIPSALTFDKQESHQFADVPVVQFSVDREQRIIEGLALPYGKIGAKYGLKFRFSPGALMWTDPSRVKLLRDHNYSQALGKAVLLTDTDAGLKVRFKVARGPEGDRALELAEDGVLDGLSVGVDFDFATDTIPDPTDKSVMLVRRADLREVSLTAMPSFDDARVTRVAASRDGGLMEECATCGQRHAPGVACPTPQPTPPPAQQNTGGVTLTNEQLALLLGRSQPQPQVQPDPEPQGRQIVDPTRSTAAFVREPQSYRFDRRGNLQRGAHEFSSDIINGWRNGDQGAQDRVMEFIRAQFDVVSTDVNELNPTRQRPDMYVDQREYRYPVWNAINKGTLSDITPFTFPKFSSAADLAAAHSEGTEPSSGTFVTTSATVTPTAISGKAKISRETWDQGGNPQIGNLIWRQMQRAWFEALEAAAVALLDAASPTQIDLSGTPGLADDQLDQALTQAFASLQFIRGGFSMDTMFTQIDLYKALVGAVSADGRRLYPALGPSNATGTVRSRFGALDINGIVALPAWALAATGTVAASSYLFDSEVVHGWASAPQRLDITLTEVANVYIGLFGYKATVISDVSGVREIVYDPA